MRGLQLFQLITKQLVELVSYVYDWLCIHNICQDLLSSCKFRQLFSINKGLGLLKLANTVLILINPSPSYVKILFQK